MSAPRLTAQQQAAVDCRDHDILVEAGAGTGKTSTSISRYARLIDDGLEPSQILVFTFTEKAANELRDRVRQMRAKTGAEFSMSSAWIGTFHSICARILRAHPIAADVDPSFTILDEIRAARMKEDSWKAALSTMTEAQDRLTDLSRFTPNQLKDGVQNAWEKLRSHGISRPVLPDLPSGRSDPAAMLASVLEFAKLTFEELSNRGNVKAEIQAVIDALSALEGRTPSWDELQSVGIASKADSLRELKGELNVLLARVAEAEFGDRINTTVGELLTEYGDEYSSRKAQAGTLDFEDLQLIALDLLENPAIAGSYREQFGEIMVDEFQDTNPLQMKLIAALRGENTTLFTVGDEMQAIYGFRHADVELFRSRRNDPTVRVLELTGNFRSSGPVIAAVNEIGSRITAEVKARRSDGATGDQAIGTSHEFKPLLNARDLSPIQGDEIQLAVTESEAWSQLDLGELAPLPKENDGGPAVDRKKTAGQYEAEALDLAHRVRRVIDQGELKAGDVVMLFRATSRMWIFEQALSQAGVPAYVVGGSGFWETREGVDLRSLLAVLANPMDDEALLGVLAGPAAGLSTDALWKLAETRDADWKEESHLGEPTVQDRPFRPRLPLWTALDRGAAELNLAEDDREKTERIVAVVNGLRRKGRLLPLGELVERMVTETGYDLISLLRDPSGAGLANIRRVATLATDFEASSGRDLRGLVEWIDASKRLDAEAAVATQDEQSDAVRLMTIHRSKGLEFPMVCVADLGRSRKSDWEHVLWIDRDPRDPSRLISGMRIPHPSRNDNLDLYAWGELYEQTNRASADEELRLLHVALTRAERRLLMTGNLKLGKEFKASEGSAPLKRIAASIEGMEDEPEELFLPKPDASPEADFEPTEARMLVHWNRATPERAQYLAQRESPLPQKESGEATGAPPLARPNLPALPDVPLSYSALSGYRECPARFFAERVLRITAPPNAKLPPKAASPLAEPLDPEVSRPAADWDGSDFGVAVHRLLEKAAGRWIMPTDGAITRELERAGVGTDEPEAAELARRMIGGFFESELGHRVRGARTETELALLIRSGNLTIRGFADLVVRADQVPLVVDYKTNRLDGMSPAAKMEPYELQRDLYALGVARALGVTEVETAYVFLDAVNDPVIDHYDTSRLELAADAIDQLTAEIGHGRYLGGPDALHQPCGGCWACDLLL